MAIEIPGGAWLLNADFIRQGHSLILRGPDGKEVYISDYFLSDPPQDLITDTGAVIHGPLALKLAGPLAPGQYASTDMPVGQISIGRVDAVEGDAKVTRSNGVTEQIQQNTDIFQGDIVITSADASIGISFVDDSIFSIGENGRMVIDEMVYDPETQEGVFNTNIVQGVFSFVSGQIAKTGVDSMTVTTPVASIGIRGTKVAGVAAQEGTENTLSLLPETVDGQQIVGEVTVSNQGGSSVLNQMGASLSVSSSFTSPPPPVVLSEAQIQQKFGSTLTTLSKANTVNAEVKTEKATQAAETAKAEAEVAQEKAEVAEAAAEEAAQEAEAQMEAAVESGDAEAIAEAEEAIEEAEEAKAEAEEVMAEAEAAVAEVEAKVEAVEEAKAVLETAKQEMEVQVKAVEAVQEAPPEEAPVEEAPPEQAPTEAPPENSSEGSSDGPGPEAEAPLEEAPLEEALLEEAPLEEAPLEEAPLEEAPLEEAPVETAPEAPPEAQVEEAPPQDAPVAEGPGPESAPAPIQETAPPPPPAPMPTYAPEPAAAATTVIASIFAAEAVAQSFVYEPTFVQPEPEPLIVVQSAPPPPAPEPEPEPDNPTIHFVNTLNQIILDLDGGTDTAQVSVAEFTLPDSVERLVFEEQLATTTSASGLESKYYTGTYLGNWENNNVTLHKEGVDANLNFRGTWKDIDDEYNLPSTNSHGQSYFTVRWEGEITAPYTGTVNFYSSHDDGARVKIDDDYIFNNWNLQGSRNYNSSGSMEMVEGQKYKFEAEMYEHGGGDVMQLYWKYPGQSTQIVPADNFTYDTTATAPTYTGYGNSSDNYLEGNDNGGTLYGYGGNDTLVGGSGVDIMYGGEGVDIFKFMSASDVTNDFIMDLTSEDKIDLVSFNIESFTYRGTDSFLGQSSTEVRYNAGSKLLEIDTDADQVSNYEVDMSYSTFTADIIDTSSFII